MADGYSFIGAKARMVCKYLPIFMKYTTGNYVSVDEARKWLFQVAHHLWCKKIGV